MGLLKCPRVRPDQLSDLSEEMMGHSVLLTLTNTVSAGLWNMVQCTKTPQTNLVKCVY